MHLESNSAQFFCSDRRIHGIMNCIWNNLERDRNLETFVGPRNNILYEKLYSF